MLRRYRQPLSIGVALGVIGVLSSIAPPPARERLVPVALAQSDPAQALAPAPHFVDTLDVSTFQRGNIHTHTSRSDGDRPPRDVYAWYRDHGYAFLAVTDHNVRSDPSTLRALERPGFVIIPGEEITMLGAGYPVHVNALCSKKRIGGKRFPDAASALEWAVGKVHEQSGVALVNHPNFHWAVTAADLDRAHGAALLEIWSGHPGVHNEGDATRPSTEAIWDTALTKGDNFAGVAVDDMHHLSKKRRGPSAARPGRGWVEVFGSETSEAAICAGLERGNLYASSGVKLRRIAVGGDSITVWPDGQATVEFIGAGGALLEKQSDIGLPGATYKLKGSERYVRARIKLPDGKEAWTQAYRVSASAAHAAL